MPTNTCSSAAGVPERGAGILGGASKIDYASLMPIPFWKKRRRGVLISDLLAKLFRGTKPEDLSISERQFPYRVRADLQRAVEQVIASEKGLARFCGLSQPLAMEGFERSALMAQSDR